MFICICVNSLILSICSIVIIWNICVPYEVFSECSIVQSALILTVFLNTASHENIIITDLKGCHSNVCADVSLAYLQNGVS